MGQAVAGRQLADHLLVAGDKGCTGNHLGYHQPRPEPRGKIAHRAVGDSGHGRKEGAIWQAEVVYAYFAGTFGQFIALKLYKGSNLVTD